MASGLNSTFRILGVAIGVAALGAVMESEVSASLAQALGTAPSGLVEIVSTGNADAAAAAEPAGLEAQIHDAAEVAFVGGLDTVFLVSAVIAFAGAVLALALVRERDLERDRGAETAPSPVPA
jgi:hypothetical protein